MRCIPRVLLPPCAWLGLLSGIGSTLEAQQYPACVLQFGVWNQARHVPGTVQAECPGGIHTWPWGNWGVDSNLGRRVDGHQFQGWCHRNLVCGYDDPPTCWIDCTDGWYEWNSCTDYFPMLRGNCYYYNYNNCTEQITATGVNSHAGGYDTVYVSCPYDLNGDGICDYGGCRDLWAYTIRGNWMYLYELDKGDWDDFITFLSFGDATVYLSCTPQYCGFAMSSWLQSYQIDPVSSQLALAIHWAAFSDPYNYCRGYLGSLDPRYNCW